MHKRNQIQIKGNFKFQTHDNGHMSHFYFLPYFAPLYLSTLKLNLVDQCHVIQDHVIANNFHVDHHG